MDDEELVRFGRSGDDGVSFTRGKFAIPEADSSTRDITFRLRDRERGAPIAKMVMELEYRAWRRPEVILWAGY